MVLVCDLDISWGWCVDACDRVRVTCRLLPLYFLKFVLVIAAGRVVAVVFSPTVTPSVPLTFCSAVGSGDRVLVPKIFVFSPLVSQRIHAHASVYRASVLSFDRTAQPPCETRFNCRPEFGNEIWMMRHVSSILYVPSFFLVSVRVCGKAMSGISSPDVFLW